jgi:hypothetical protein
MTVGWIQQELALLRCVVVPFQDAREAAPRQRRDLTGKNM